MKPKSLFLDTYLKFSKSGEPVSRPQINHAIPEEFVGKEDVVRFYTQHNGGVFKSLAYFYRDTFHKVTKRDRNLMAVLEFLRLPRKGPSDADYHLTVNAEREGFLNGPIWPEIKDFLISHIPIACVFRSMWAPDSIGCGHLILFDVGSVSVGMWAAFFVLP